MTTFISKPVNGFIYVAELRRKNSRMLRWFVMPEQFGPDHECGSRYVPLEVRKEAAAFFFAKGVIAEV